MFPRHLRVPIVMSIIAALVTLGLKTGAYALTGSVGLLSDAVESLVNLVAATTAYFSLWFAHRPVDANHTYGHEKIEFFSSGLEGMLILMAAGGIALLALQRLFEPQPLEALGLGSVISLTASLINFAVAVVLLRAGKKYQSIVLEADGHHLMTDVRTSAGVLAAIFLVWLTDWKILDPLIALLMAGNIVWTAFDLLRRSFNGLMDHALPADEQQLVRVALDGLMKPGLHYHALRTRQAGARRFVDFHLLVPGRWTVQEAHDFTGKVEDAVRLALPQAEISVHIEPIEEKASWEDSALLSVEHDQMPPP